MEEKESALDSQIKIPDENAVLDLLGKGALNEIGALYAPWFTELPSDMRMEDKCLCAAVLINHEKMVDALLTGPLKVNINVRTKEGDTPLLLAIKENHPLSLIERMIKAKADVNCYDNDGITPLIHAVEFQRLDIARALLNAHAKVNYAVETGKYLGKSALRHAALKGDREMILLLFEKKAELVDKKGRSPLNLAVKSNNVEVIDLFVKKIDQHNQEIEKHNQNVKDWVLGAFEGAFLKETLPTLYFNDPDQEVGKANRKHLENAIKEGNIPLVDYLVKINAISISTFKEWLDIALKADQSILVTSFLEKADPMERTAALMTVLTMEKINIAESILKTYGIDVHYPLGDSSTFLHRMAANGKLKSVQLLLRYGANLHRTDNVGETPLHKAAAKGHVAVVLELLENGATIDQPRDDRKTALMVAAEQHHEAVAGAFVSHHARLDLKDIKGKKASDLAKEERVFYFLDPKNRVHHAASHLFPLLWGPSFTKTEWRLPVLKEINAIVKHYADYVAPVAKAIGGRELTEKKVKPQDMNGIAPTFFLGLILADLVSTLPLHLNDNQRSSIWQYGLQNAEGKTASSQEEPLKPSQGAKKFLDYVFRDVKDKSWVDYVVERMEAASGKQEKREI